MSFTFARVVMLARELGQQTAAEQDWDMAHGGSRHIWNAIYILATQDLPEGTPFAARAAADNAARARLLSEFNAMVAAAKTKAFEGWSDAARARGQRIRYAR